MSDFIKAYSEVRPLTAQELDFLTAAVAFNMLKQAFKYAYICLPKKEFAQKKAYSFIEMYKCLKNLDKSERKV